MSLSEIASTWISNKFIRFFLCCADGSILDLEMDNAITEYLERKCELPPTQVESLRQIFTDVPDVRMRSVENHTHGDSAAARSTASLIIDQIGTAVGRNIVFFQGSKADLRNDRKISRSYFWTKDLGVPSIAYRPSVRDLVALVDVDYYVDMPAFLSREFRPALLYSFQPSRVSKCDGEYKYTFDRTGNVDYRVSGGARYCHKVWSYDGDSLKITKSWFGICYSMTTFLVERRRIDDDHQLLLLVPTARFKHVAAYIANKRLGGNELQRLNPVVNDSYLRMTTSSKNGLLAHTGKVDCFSSSCIPIAIDDEIASMSLTCKTGLSLSMVKGKVQDHLHGVELLHEYYVMNKERTRSQNVSVPDVRVRSFQWLSKPGDFDDAAKPSMVSFMEPIVDGAFCPSMCKNNDQRAVDKRVKEVKGTSDLTPFLVKIINEFVDMFTRRSLNELVPVDQDEVYEHQSRPTQRRILDDSHYEVSNTVTKTFVKRECYQNINDPRMISTINGVDKRDYSAYMYALAGVLKRFPWYAFGKSPLELADRVTWVCEHASGFVNGSDFSRMDGRVSEVARHLEQSLMMALFRIEYHEDILRLMRTQYGLKGKSRFGVNYDTSLSRLSGSPETSPFNTILNVFTAFLALRMTQTPTGFVTKGAAWRRLGVYGGDDGLSADIDFNTYSRAAAMVGQKLTSDVVKRGDVGVMFLARQYGPDVWYGNNNSVCDYARLLSKFHCTVTMPSNITATSKLVDKSHAVWLSDKNTPIVGEFVCRVRELFGEHQFKNICGAYIRTTDADKTYPNFYGEWMTDLFVEQLPDFNVTSFRKWLAIATKETILKPPAFMERVEAKMKPGLADIDGDLLIDGQSLNPQNVTSINKDKVKRPRARKPKSDRTGKYNETKSESGSNSTKSSNNPAPRKKMRCQTKQSGLKTSNKFDALANK